MASTVGQPATERPRKMLAMKGEALRKKFAEAESNEEIGRLILRAIALVKLTPQEVAYRMGYSDQSALSRWIAGSEPARFGKLWSLRVLRAGLVLAMAEEADGLCVQMVVTSERKAVGQ